MNETDAGKTNSSPCADYSVFGKTSPAAWPATPWRSEMKKIAILTLILGSCTPAPAYAVVRGSAAVSVYPNGDGQCLYFQGSRYWIAPC